MTAFSYDFPAPSLSPMPSGHHFVAPSISPLPSGQHFMDSTLTLDFHKFPRFSSFCIFWILARSTLSVISSFCSPSERINKGIFGDFEVFGRLSSFSSWMQGLETKISSPLGRARRVLLVTSMEHLEHVPRRIRGEITWIPCQLYLRVPLMLYGSVIRLKMVPLDGESNFASSTTH
jgi:hypothetical protein